MQKANAATSAQRLPSTAGFGTLIFRVVVMNAGMIPHRRTSETSYPRFCLIAKNLSLWAGWVGYLALKHLWSIPPYTPYGPSIITTTYLFIKLSYPTYPYPQGACDEQDARVRLWAASAARPPLSCCRKCRSKILDSDLIDATRSRNCRLVCRLRCRRHLHHAPVPLLHHVAVELDGSSKVIKRDLMVTKSICQFCCIKKQTPYWSLREGCFIPQRGSMEQPHNFTYRLYRQ
jgi:hypothetical protein